MRLLVTVLAAADPSIPRSARSRVRGLPKRALHRVLQMCKLSFHERFAIKGESVAGRGRFSVVCVCERRHGAQGRTGSPPSEQASYPWCRRRVPSVGVLACPLSIPSSRQSTDSAEAHRAGRFSPPLAAHRAPPLAQHGLTCSGARSSRTPLLFFNFNAPC